MKSGDVLYEGVFDREWTVPPERLGNIQKAASWLHVKKTRHGTRTENQINQANRSVLAREVDSYIGCHRGASRPSLVRHHGHDYSPVSVSRLLRSGFRLHKFSGRFVCDIH